VQVSHIRHDSVIDSGSIALSPIRFWRKSEGTLCAAIMGNMRFGRPADFNLSNTKGSGESLNVFVENLTNALCPDCRAD